MFFGEGDDGNRLATDLMRSSKRNTTLLNLLPRPHSKRKQKSLWMDNKNQRVEWNENGTRYYFEQKEKRGEIERKSDRWRKVVKTCRIRRWNEWRTVNVTLNGKRNMHTHSQWHKNQKENETKYCTSLYVTSVRKPLNGWMENTKRDDGIIAWTLALFLFCFIDGLTGDSPFLQLRRRN